MHELRERLRLLMAPQVRALLVGQLVPDRRAEDRDQAIVDLLRVLGVDARAEFGQVPREPVILWGWGWLPDQYGREVEDDPGAY